ncbi:hypothetical protein [Salmonella phage SSBI34]|nr:hypothetical protein [Salmonella phage SSBI34]
MSIFDNTFIEPGWNCISATKNITAGQGCKYVNLNLVYELGDRQAEVGAAYAINYGGKVSCQVPVKMLVKLFDTSGDPCEDPTIIFKRSLKAFRPDEITEVVIKDINMANMMFEKADKEVQRVYL